MIVDDDVCAGIGLVSVDWFSMSCRLCRPWADCILCPPNGMSAVRLTPTAVWSERWYILDADGNKVCTILAVPRSWKIAADRCVIEVANRWLYYSDFHERLDTILSILPLVVDGLNRVDLCCDFEMTKRMFDVYQMMSDGRAYVGAYKSGAVFWRDFPIGRVANQLSWGGKDSVLHWKVYYKTLELTEADEDAKKPYIVDTWRLHGLDVSSVWRCEVSISGSKNLADVATGRAVHFRDWYDRRAELWQSLYASRFVVRRAEGHKDKRNDTQLTFLDVTAGKILRSALPSSSRDDSDPERRLLAKLWAEWQQVDVQANSALRDMLRASIFELCQRPACWYALQRMSGLTAAELSNAFADA